MCKKIPKFDALKDALTNARRFADNELNNFELLTNELKEEISQNSLKINKYITDISGYKTEIMNKNNEIYNLTKNNDNINENYNLLDEEHKSLQNKLQNTEEYHNTFRNQVTNLIHQIFQNFNTTRYQKYAELINYQSFSESRVL